MYVCHVCTHVCTQPNIQAHVYACMFGCVRAKLACALLAHACLICRNRQIPISSSVLKIVGPAATRRPASKTRGPAPTYSQRTSSTLAYYRASAAAVAVEPVSSNSALHPLALAHTSQRPPSASGSSRKTSCAADAPPSVVGRPALALSRSSRANDR